MRLNGHNATLPHYFNYLSHYRVCCLKVNTVSGKTYPMFFFSDVNVVHTFLTFLLSVTYEPCAIDIAFASVCLTVTRSAVSKQRTLIYLPYINQ